VIQPGADADIIACAENPLQNIYALANIVWVMREGKVVFDKRKGGSLNEANLFYT
jgi:imidazolonepropionase-like amidohydrolase